MLTPARRSGPVGKLPALIVTRQAADLVGRPPRPPDPIPPLPLEARPDTVAVVLLDGLSYRRAGRMVGISKTEVGDAAALERPQPRRHPGRRRRHRRLAAALEPALGAAAGRYPVLIAVGD